MRTSHMPVITRSKFFFWGGVGCVAAYIFVWMHILCNACDILDCAVHHMLCLSYNGQLLMANFFFRGGWVCCSIYLSGCVSCAVHDVLYGVVRLTCLHRAIDNHIWSDATTGHAMHSSCTMLKNIIKLCNKKLEVFSRKSWIEPKILLLTWSLKLWV